MPSPFFTERDELLGRGWFLILQSKRLDLRVPGWEEAYLICVAKTRTNPGFCRDDIINPLFVLSEMDENKVKDFSSGLCGSATLGVGQFCTNPGVCFTLAENGEKFITQYADEMKEVSASPMLHSGIRMLLSKG